VAPGDGEAIWFLGTLNVIKVSGEQTGGRYALFESLLPEGASPPVHTHPQDESFWVLEGDMRGWLDGEISEMPEGSFFFAPAGAPHSFLVTSPFARALFLSTPAGIEGFIRAGGEPAPELVLPPPSTPGQREKAGIAEKQFDVQMLAQPPF
jgi:quercetin dioxygenase-like cupin family protein